MNYFKRILWVLWAGFMVPVLLPWAIAPVPAAAAQGPMLRIEAIPGVDQLVDIETRVRHTTVIVLPENENILDFVVGDSECWHLTGAANVAFLKPIATGVETNVALICESGRIYSFLASEGGEPHLVVRIEPPPEDATLISAEPHTPAFIARSEVTAYQVMAQQARETARNAQVAADALAAEARAEAQAAVEDFRADYPTRLHFVYSLSDRALDPPFHVEAMWHDGQFTYLRSHAQESPALYEAVDGDPTLVAYDLTADGLFIVRRILDSGWLQLGERRAMWRYEPER